VDIYLPEDMKGCGTSIITTQKAHMSKLTADFFKFELQPLSSDAGARLLLDIIKDGPHKDEEKNEIAREISRWVGGLPLALVTIGGYAKVSGCELDMLFGSLKRSSRVWADHGTGDVHNYSKTLATVFDVALEDLGKNENSRHLIDLMAFLNPDEIPEELFTQPQRLPSLKFLNDGDE
jgi:hypothetical protein